MFDLLQNASDDQLALMGCLAALLLSGGLMYVSFYMGRSLRGEREQSVAALPARTGPDPLRRDKAA